MRWIFLLGWVMSLSLIWTSAGMVEANQPHIPEADYAYIGATKGCTLDLMLVLDGSGSIEPANFDLMRNFAMQLVAYFPISSEEANIGIVQFATTTVLHQALSGDLVALNSTIDTMGQLGSGTNIAGGMELAQTELGFGRPDVADVMIVLTDGVHTEGGDPIAVANTIRNQGTQIIGIAVGDVELDELIAITGGDRNVYFVYGFDGLPVIVDLLTNSACQEVLPPRPTKIVFASDRDGDYEIYTIEPDGSNLRQLTFNEAWDDKPSWSKDGTRIAFESDLDGDFEIFSMNADGSNLQQLTFNDTDDWGPAWSPDGNSLAFHSDRDGDVELYVMANDGTNVQQVTNNSSVDRSASWSPDGRRVVYYSDVSGGRELYIIDVFGGGAFRLTSNSFYDGLPDWSLNGMQIVFASTREQDDVEIYTMRINGQNVRRLTSSPGVDDDPVWSPDGRQIVFESERNGNLDIWIMNADGSNLYALTDHPANDWSADWIWTP